MFSIDVKWFNTSGEVVFTEQRQLIRLDEVIGTIWAILKFERWPEGAVRLLYDVALPLR